MLVAEPALGRGECLFSVVAQPAGPSQIHVVHLHLLEALLHREGLGMAVVTSEGVCVESVVECHLAHAPALVCKGLEVVAPAAESCVYLNRALMPADIVALVTVHIEHGVLLVGEYPAGGVKEHRLTMTAEAGKPAYCGMPGEDGGLLDHPFFLRPDHRRLTARRYDKEQEQAGLRPIHLSSRFFRTAVRNRAGARA